MFKHDELNKSIEGLSLQEKKRSDIVEINFEIYMYILNFIVKIMILF